MPRLPLAEALAIAARLGDSAELVDDDHVIMIHLGERPERGGVHTLAPADPPIQGAAQGTPGEPQRTQSSSQSEADDGVTFHCAAFGCPQYGKALEVPAMWARIGVNCRVCGIPLQEGGTGTVEAWR